MKAALALALAALAAAPGGDAPRVLARAGGDTVAALALPASREFALEYVHSVYRAPARERFRARPGGGFDLVAVASPSAAVLDYYELDGARERRAGWWTLRLARPARFGEMALAATRVGRRTLAAAGRRAPLYGGPVHLTIAVEGT